MFTSDLLGKNEVWLFLSTFDQKNVLMDTQRTNVKCPVKVKDFD